LAENLNFSTFSIKELNDILNKFEGLKKEYESLKSNFKENEVKLSNLDKKLCDVTDNNLNTFSKPLYIVAFLKKINISMILIPNLSKKITLKK
jgi:cell shape-determining protein MreC